MGLVACAGKLPGIGIAVASSVLLSGGFHPLRSHHHRHHRQHLFCH